MKHTITLLIIPALLLTGCISWPEPGSLIPTLTALAASPTHPATVTQAATVTPRPQESPGATETPTLDVCIVTAAEALNLRTGPGVEYPVTYWLAAGDVLRIAKSFNGWLYVTTQDGRAGWVNSIYCE